MRGEGAGQGGWVRALKVGRFLREKKKEAKKKREGGVVRSLPWVCPPWPPICCIYSERERNRQF